MIDITPFQQTDSSRCGPAVVKMILDYYGIDVSEDELCKRCNHSYELGCDDHGMVSALSYYGLGVKVYENSTLEDLDYWVKHNIPVIVDWFAGGNAFEDCANGHSSIVVDTDDEKVYLLDPFTGKIIGLIREEFLRVWFDWRTTPYIQSWESMILRQIIVPYPKRLTEKVSGGLKHLKRLS